MSNTQEEQGKPFLSPVYNVRAVPLDKLRANSYNPNAVAPPEMKLLEKSIWEDGFTMPIVCYYIPGEDVYEIVDGYHRFTVMKTSSRVHDREAGMVPVVVIDKDISNRIASTIRHNRARGSHDISLMSNIVSELVQAGMSDAWIMRNIGMDADELLRLKQITGLAALFRDRDFSDAWKEDLEEEFHSLDSLEDEADAFDSLETPGDFPGADDPSPGGFPGANMPMGPFAFPDVSDALKADAGGDDPLATPVVTPVTTPRKARPPVSTPRKPTVPVSAPRKTTASLFPEEAIPAPKPRRPRGRPRTRHLGVGKE
jgi:ParB-like chromosome segregation protein Spo0J